MERRMVEDTKVGYDRHSLGVRMLVALIALSVIGTIICVTLAILRVAVETVVVTAGVLALVGMVCVVWVNGVKYRIEAIRYRRELDTRQQESFDS